MKTSILLLTTCLAVSLLCATRCPGQTLGNYRLSLDKRNQDAANLYVSCSFTIDFGQADSISLNFGGAEDFSIDSLDIRQDSVNVSAAYNYRRADRRLVFYAPPSRKADIRMSYVYTNMTSFFIYGKGDAELWETSYKEYYYPYLSNASSDMSVHIALPDSLLLVASYPMAHDSGTHSYSCRLSHVLAQSLSLAFLRKEVYVQSAAALPDTVPVYQIRGMECDAKRYAELQELASASIRYFGRIYGEAYVSDSLGISSPPAFLFHNGEGFSNRYNIGFISASQEKFATYPDIYPLVHEMGHRWLGEWTLLIDDGEPGAYFIKESLNEFMTSLFVRHHLGEEAYRAVMERCERSYRTIKGTDADTPLIEVVANNNNVVVYEKGPWLLDRIARKTGYDNLAGCIAQFYRQFARKQPLRYTDFIGVLTERFPEAGRELDEKVRGW